jgi:hypothetical protein
MIDLKEIIYRLCLKYGIQDFSNLYSNVNIMESNSAWILILKNELIQTHSSSRDDFLGMGNPTFIVSKASGDFYGIPSAIDIQVEFFIFGKWEFSNKEYNYYTFRQKEFNSLDTIQYKFEKNVRDSQRVDLQFFGNRLLIGSTEIIKFSLRNIKLIGQLDVVLPNSFVYDSWLIMVKGLNDWFWVSENALNFDIFQKRVTKKFRDYHDLGKNPTPSVSRNGICWIADRKREYFNDYFGKSIFSTYDIVPNSSKEKKLVKSFGRYPLRGKLSGIKVFVAHFAAAIALPPCGITVAALLHSLLMPAPSPVRCAPLPSLALLGSPAGPFGLRAVTFFASPAQSN